MLLLLLLRLLLPLASVIPFQLPNSSGKKQAFPESAHPSSGKRSSEKL